MEQVDEIIDHSIEIESNKRMRNANVNLWTLRFKDQEMEHQVLRNYTCFNTVSFYKHVVLTNINRLVNYHKETRISSLSNKII